MQKMRTHQNKKLFSILPCWIFVQLTLLLISAEYIKENFFKPTQDLKLQEGLMKMKRNKGEIELNEYTFFRVLVEMDIAPLNPIKRYWILPADNLTPKLQ